MSGYQYQPLKKDLDKIRLLHVHPSYHSPKEPLVCDLRTVKLHDRSEYAALSYTGNPEEFSELFVNGVPFRVRKNLDSALRSFRTTTWQMLWADAICIDQSDNDERSQQVQMMYQISSQAKRVFVFFGDGGADSIKALGTMYVGCREAPEAGSAARLLSEWELSGWRSTEWKSVYNMMMQPWPLRTWVVQEAVACPSLTILYGHGTYGPIADNEIYWNEFVATVNFLRDGLFANAEFVAPTETNFKHAVQIVRTIDFLRRTPEKKPLIYLVRGLRYTVATDPQDKIFALHSLASDGAEYEAPDYNKPVKDVYTEFAVTTLSQSPDQLNSLLAEAGVHKQQLKGLPSWVPDWSCPPLLNYANFFRDVGMNDKGQLEAFDEGHSILLSYSNGVKLQENCQPLLAVKGRLLDVITNLGPAMMPVDGHEYDYDGHLQWVRASMKMLASEPGLDKQRFRTVITGGLLEPSASTFGANPNRPQRAAEAINKDREKYPWDSGRTLTMADYGPEEAE